MIIETIFGHFILLKNYRDAFSKVKFEQRYVDITYSKYDYIVGDVASDMLRLKGFSSKSKNNYQRIPDYLNQICNYNTPYYILKRVDKDVPEHLISERDKFLSEIELKYLPFQGKK